eukprot:2694059-Amphidinium_carterae.1
MFNMGSHMVFSQYLIQLQCKVQSSLLSLLYRQQAAFAFPAWHFKLQGYYGLDGREWQLADVGIWIHKRSRLRILKRNAPFN